MTYLLVFNLVVVLIIKSVLWLVKWNGIRRRERYIRWLELWNKRGKLGVNNHTARRLWPDVCYLGDKCRHSSWKFGTRNKFLQDKNTLKNGLTFNPPSTKQGVKLLFFSDSQSGSQFKKSWSPFLKTNKTFFWAASVLDRPSKIKLEKRSLTCYKVDTRMDNIQCSSSSKSKMASINWWEVCAAFWKQTSWGSLLQIYLCKSF